jgi:redox-sensitive bicupin YhaK (pirin superfamily)
MFGITFATALGEHEHLNGTPSPTGVSVGSRRIALLRSGRRHGRITRLITPWDLGELTQPFVFLCYSELAPGAKTVVGVQPGIGTLTLVLSGVLVFEEALGNKGMVAAGGFSWAAPGEVGWHAGGRAADEPLRTLQLWVELPRNSASSTPQSQCVAPHEVQEEGSVRVVLGQIGRARSRIGHAPPDVNYFHVRLKHGQRWRYTAPDGHNVTWLAVDRGGLSLEEDGRVLREQIALFGRSPGVIEVQAEGESSFVLGSARQDSNAVMQSGRLPIDTTLEAFVPGEIEGAAERPVAARSGPPLRIASTNPELGVNAAPALDRRLAPSKQR